MTDTTPPTEPERGHTPMRPETLLDISMSGPLPDAGQSVLARLDAAQGSKLSENVVQLRDSQQDTRPAGQSTDGYGNRQAAQSGVRYADFDELGRGGMGIVMKVRDNDLRRDVAMKIVRGDRVRVGTEQGRVALRRFVEEAQITGQLEHPNIVPVHELGADATGRVYFTMKLVKGRPLSLVLRDLRNGDKTVLRDFPLDRLLQVFMKVCDAIGFAHAHNVIHRDLKPENIMLGRFGEVMVMDWGLARLLDHPEHETAANVIRTDSRPGGSSTSSRNVPSAFSMDGTIAGTPAYMAPEQARGEISRIDQTTDIFALGAILYDILVLKPPYTGESGTVMLEQATRGDILRPEVRIAAEDELRHAAARLPGGRVPPELSSVVMHALALKQTDRYPTALALKEDVENYMAGRPVTVRRDPIAVRAAKWVRRHPTLSVSTAAALAVVLVSMVVIMGLVAQARQEAIEQQQLLVAASAEQEREATLRAKAEGDAASKERALKEAALERENALARRAEATRLYRLGAIQAERARDISDAALREAAFTSAQTTLQQAAEHDPAYLDPQFTLARLLHIFSDPRAVDAYRAVHRLARRQGLAGDARALVYAGDFVRYHDGDLELARSLYAEAAEVSPDDPLALVGRGYVALYSGRLAEAVELAQRARGIDASMWETYMLEGTVLGSFFEPGDKRVNVLFDPVLAESLLSLGVQRNNREAALYNERGTARMELGDLQGAAQDFTTAMELWPNRPEPRFNLVVVLRKSHKLDIAERYVRELLKRYPDAHGGWLELANVLLHQGRQQEAIEALEHSLTLAPDRPAPLCNIALAYMFSGEDRKAVTYAQRAVDAEPLYYIGWYMLAGAHERLGEFEAALKAVDQCLSVRPDWPQALAQRADVLIRLGRLSEALADAEKALAHGSQFDVVQVSYARALAATKQPEKARPHLLKALELNPGSQEAMINLAMVCRNAGEAAEAEEWARRCLTYPALKGYAELELGNALLLQNRPLEALEAFTQATVARPELTDAWLNAAATANTLKLFKQARDFALQSTRLIAQDTKSWVNLCESEIGLGDLDAAGKALDKALSLPPGSVEERIDLGAMLFNLRRLDAALVHIQQVITDAPGHASAHELLARIYIVGGKPADALAPLNESIRLAPGRTLPLSMKADVLLKLGKLPECIETCRQLLDLDPMYYHGYWYMGVCRLQRKEYALAIESLEAAARIDAGSATLWMNMGFSHLNLKNYSRMLECYEKATVVAPQDAVAWATLGEIREMMQDSKGALQAYRQALKLDPDNLPALYKGSSLASTQGDRETAVAWATRATELAPQNPGTWFRLGTVLYEAGRFAEALDAYTQGEKTAPGNAFFPHLRAQTLLASGKHAEAMTAAKEALKLDANMWASHTVIAQCHLVANDPDAAMLAVRAAFDAGAKPADIYPLEWVKQLESHKDWPQLQQDYPPK